MSYIAEYWPKAAIQEAAKMEKSHTKHHESRKLSEKTRKEKLETPHVGVCGPYDCRFQYIDADLQQGFKSSYGKVKSWALTVEEDLKENSIDDAVFQRLQQRLSPTKQQDLMGLLASNPVQQEMWVTQLRNDDRHLYEVVFRVIWRLLHDQVFPKKDPIGTRLPGSSVEQGEKGSIFATVQKLLGEQDKGSKARNQDIEQGIIEYAAKLHQSICSAELASEKYGAVRHRFLERVSFNEWHQKHHCVPITPAIVREVLATRQEFLVIKETVSGYKFGEAKSKTAEPLPAQAPVLSQSNKEV
ncbi:hypothetical protein B0T26DRAFT_675962 [Lasiosphaeria miniovina]|uniref:Uncharacterized protein n=1 Tax=Lasiosphaeria miniovina TaxID=1954250 RepID=A0AA40AKT1_9PEZI|nr:uncharacterized protein B0T26DRAFT_675962 [Lasiosphaeria miniovina]KAK0717686.1 hypothetical protein B0T26DRAFT_675962 [Lasiosphaeria miniovina]